MITHNAVEVDRVGKVARLEAENARLRKLAAKLNADLRKLRLAEALTSRSAIDPERRLLVMSGG
jgi:hypothetical protein